ncbi:MAG: PQQ-binding-like beta-propeller repeat protein [Pirellulales bacterium]|nr:PQQ-binding-like beta-propeller repeat protein [Pirellulales bacterium]
MRCSISIIAAIILMPLMLGLFDPMQLQSIATQESPSDIMVPCTLALGPYVRYVTPSEAVVHWRTTAACASVLEYGIAGPGAKYSPSIQLLGSHQGSLEQRIEDNEPKKQHAISIRGLRLNAIYAYRVKIMEAGQERSSPVYELDTALNYSPQPLPRDIPFTDDLSRHDQIQALVQEVLRQGVTQGYCLVWGLEDGALAQALAMQTDLTVLGVDEDPRRVDEVRRRLYRAGIYGTRISVQEVKTMAAVPYPSNFANLIVSERIFTEFQCPGQASEIMRVLQPRVGIVVFFCPAFESPVSVMAVADWFKASAIYPDRHRTKGGWFHIIRKPSLTGIGSWTHQYGDAGNTADSHDDLGGVTGIDGLQVQWLGNPGADFGMDRNPRMPAPLAVHGKLFHQGMNRMVAIDAYNGSILWSLEIPAMQRVNLPRDASNWCTNQDSLYVAINHACWIIAHHRGSLKDVLELPRGLNHAQYDWGYVAEKNGFLFASAVRKNTIYTDFWGNRSWYDKTNGEGTEKVCSDAVFAYDLNTREVMWIWKKGLVINTTLAVGTRAIYFVESRNQKLQESAQRRLNNPRLWSDQYLVALDHRTGNPLWEIPIAPQAGIVTFFLSARDEGIVLVSSAAGRYSIDAFDPATGQRRWHAEHAWPSDNHGGHMQHPVVLADKVFLEPCGYDLETGYRFTSAMSAREGCATYCGTKYALIHRGQSRQVTMWDFRNGKVTGWYNLRPSCWLSTIASEGMVLSPEGGGGCSCGNWLETSLAFAPRKHLDNADESPPPKPE